MDASDDAQGGMRTFANRMRRLITVLAIAAAVAALVGELRKPKDKRTWHGTVGGFVPYDFRLPTMDRIKERTANPDGPILAPQVVGVGWTLNVGGLLARLKQATGSAATS